MASENETVEDIVRELRDDASKVADEQHDEDCWTNLEAMQIYDSLASRIESAWRREKAELERKVREHHLAFLAENARHTDTYKDERIRAQDAEIKTLKSEVAELREYLKDAVKSYCEGCNDFVDGKQKCEPCECKARKWRKALEGADDEGK